MNRIKYFLEKVRETGLSKSEFDEVAQIMSTTNDHDIKCKCVIILKYESSRDREEIVSSELYADDQILQAEAMRFLVKDLNMGSKYQNFVIGFLRNGEKNYGLNTLPLAALSVSGDAYRSSKNPEVLFLILKLLEHERKSLRNAAHDALVAALTENHQKLPPNERYELAKNADITMYKNEALKTLGKYKIRLRPY